MIAHFYKIVQHDYKNPVLLVTKNIGNIPPKGSLVKFSGQVFRIDNIVFMLDTCEYKIVVTRV